MRSESKGNLQATMGQRLLCMLLSAALACSSMPSAALQAIAQEQGDAAMAADADLDEATGSDEDQDLEQEPSEGASDEDPVVGAENPDEEPDPVVTDEPDSDQPVSEEPAPEEPAPAEDDPQPVTEEPEPTPEAETPSEKTSKQQLEGLTDEAAPVEESAKARGGQLRSAPTPTPTIDMSVTYGETPQIDGVYADRTIYVTVTGTNLSHAAYAKIYVEYKDYRGEVHQTSVTTIGSIVSGDNTTYTGSATVYTTGTYTGIWVEGLQNNGEEVTASYDLEIRNETFVVERPTVTSVLMKDANGTYITTKDESNNVINKDLLDAHVSTVERAASLEVTLMSHHLSYDTDVDASKSKAIAVKADGTVVAAAPFAPKKDADGNDIPNTYVAELGSTSNPLPEEAVGIKVVAEDTSGNPMCIGSGFLKYLLVGATAESDGSDPRANGHIVLDRTAPTFQSVTLNDQALASNGVYGVNEADVCVFKATVSDTGDHFDTTASSMTFTDAIGNEYNSFGGSATWDGNSVTYNLPEGAYSVSYRLVDTAGNVTEANSLYTNVIVDGTAPVIDVYLGELEDYVFSSASGYHTDIWKKALEPVVTITETNWSLADTTITVTGTSASNLPQYDPSAWTSVGNVYTYNLALADGAYQLEVSTKDAAGNIETYSESVVIDTQAPVVTTDYPDVEPYAIDGKKCDFFDEAKTFTVTIADRNLQEETTTVVGARLEDILASTASVEGVSFTVESDDTDATTGMRTVVLTVSFVDGVYALPLVHAEDWVTSDDATHIDEDSHLSDFMVVDGGWPEVLAAALAADPADLGNDASGNAIINGQESANGFNRVFFFKASEADGVALTLRVKELYGIQKVELYDPSNRYTLADVDAAIAAGNVGIATSGHTGEYEFEVIDALAEGKDFSDSVTITITDIAGNEGVWMINGTGLVDLLTPGFSGNPLGLPTLLVLDVTPPAITLTGPVDRTDAVDPAYKRYYDSNQKVTLTVEESSIKYLRGFEGGSEGDTYGDVNDTYDALDPNRSVLTVAYTAPTSGATSTTSHVTVSDLTTKNNGLNYTWTHTYEDDGDYEITAQVKDVVGLSSEAFTIEKFTIDSTAPEIVVSFDPDPSTMVDYRYLSNTCTATITVTEHNFDSGLFNIEVKSSNTPAGYAFPSYDASAWTSDGDTHTYTLVFDTDGNYSFMVTGKDAAGNNAEYFGDDYGYASDIFTIDTEAPAIAKYYENGSAPSSSFDADDPVVELPKPTGTYGGKDYYSHAINIDAKVQDRNINTNDLTLSVTKDGSEKTLTPSWELATEDRGANGRQLYETTVPYVEDGEYLAPHVTAKDLALNASDNVDDAKDHAFIIDLKAPTITAIVDHDPSAQGTSGSSDPYNFYNQATKMTFTVSDEHLLRSAQLDDPSGQYTISVSEASAEGKGQVTLTASLKDGSVAQDAEYQRDIVLTAVDLAGNRRTWTIDHTGTVVLDEVSSTTENSGINGGSEHPQALIQDTVAPIVGLSGVTEGTYYNTAQSVEATVEELNFDYLQTFDGGRSIVTVTSYEGNAGRAQSTSTITANDFSGSKPSYNYVESFTTDGHYELSAQFADYAGNLSNLATIGEFTIDTTAPTIEVTWDNEDVRNDKYYKETRTATITVTEHNFDPSLFTIDTTGTIGDWTTDGDVHTCTVFFDEGSAHTLTVRGADLAGNDAGVYNEPEFVVDLTEPEIEIAGTAQRLGYLDDETSEGLINAYHGDLEDKSAYNGVVVPIITYKDNEPLISEDLTYTVSGTKHGEEIELDAITSEESTEMATTFRDFGYVGPDSGDGSNWDDFYVDDYAVDADDIYTIKATMTDQAGNEAEAEITFSVNRYGSNYVVSLQGLDADAKAEYASSGMLWEAPTIVVREVNVCGVERQADHHVQKEFANVTTAIAESDGTGIGYSLKAIEGEDQENGWSEYVYTIRSANFGAGSDSDNNDRGQGQYRVNVMSDDRSSNANSTAAYWGSDDARTQAATSWATTQFVLDEVAPVIDDLDLPEHLSAGQSYEASFHVTDDITSGNIVRVYLDGVELNASELSGPKSGVGTFSFTIPAKAFNWSRSVRIEVTDYAGRMDEATNGTWIWQSSFIPEAAAGVGAVAVVAAGVVYWRRRQAAKEPELLT